MPRLQIQVQITTAAALALAAGRIRDARFADAAQARNHRTAVRFPRKVSLDRCQYFVGIIAGKPMKLPGEWLGFDELHVVIVPQCGSSWQRCTGCVRFLAPKTQVQKTNLGHPPERSRVGTTCCAPTREDLEAREGRRLFLEFFAGGGLFLVLELDDIGARIG